MDTPRRGDNGERVEAVSEEERDATLDPALRSRIIKGEQLVKEGKGAVDKGQTEKAYEKYCRGLQYLLDVMPKIGEDRPAAKALRLRINGYLDDAEKLKQKLDAGEAKAVSAASTSGPPPSSTATPDEPPMLAAMASALSKSNSLREKGGSAEAKPGEDKVPPGTGGDALFRSRGDRGEARDREGQQQVQLERNRVDRGEALVREGQQLERNGHLDEAYEKYCRGLQYLLEMMPKLGEDNPHVASLRLKISGYLEQAEKLKERLEVQEGSGPTGPSSTRMKEDRGPGPRAEVAGLAARSRSHHRHHKRHTLKCHSINPHRVQLGGRRKLSVAPSHHRPIEHRRKDRSRSRDRRRQKDKGKERHGGMPPPPPGMVLRPGPKSTVILPPKSHHQGSMHSEDKVPATRLKAPPLGPPSSSRGQYGSNSGMGSGPPSGHAWSKAPSRATGSRR